MVPVVMTFKSLFLDGMLKHAWVESYAIWDLFQNYKDREAKSGWGQTSCESTNC